MNTPARHCRALCALLTLFAALAYSQGAAAATLTANSTGDAPDAAVGDGACATSSGACTLRAAIQEANALAGGDTINITATGTINLTGALPDLNTAMVITGPGSGLLTIRRDTGGVYRIFTVTDGATVTISSLTVSNGKAPDGVAGVNAGYGGHGGGINNSGTLTLTGVTLSGNQSGAGAAGGMDFFLGGYGGAGGGVYNLGTLTMTDCVVSNNSTGAGGDGRTAGPGGSGGGIFNAGPMNLTDVVVVGNTTGAAGNPSDGGGFGAGGFGGGISSQGATTTLTRVRVINNVTGGAPLGNGGDGGGLFLAGTTVTLTDSTVSGNSTGTSANGSPGFGGGIQNRATLIVSGSTFSGNIGLFGGAIHNQSSLSITNSTLSGNRVSGAFGGAAINSDNNSPLKLTNCTLTANEGPAVIHSGAVLRNSILAGNNGGAGPDVAGGSYTSQGHNLVGNAGGSTGFIASDKVGTSGAPLDPRLGPLADNGGPTLTHALLPGSPALDGGDNSLAVDASSNTLTKDQRGAGFTRFADSADADTTATVDIGAFEAHPSVEDVTDKVTGEDTQLSFPFSLGDADIGVSSVTAASNNLSLVPDANLSVTGTGSTRTLQIAPAANQSGSAVITLTITGSNGRAASDTFVLSVIPVNDPPTFTKGPDLSAAEDSGPQSVANWVTSVSAGQNESSQSVAFFVVGSTNPGLFSAPPSVSPSGALTYTPAADASGVASVTLVLKDDGGTANGGQDTSAPQTFQITVTPVNDAPVNAVPGPQSVDENGHLVFSAAGGNRISVSDIDAGQNPVAVTLTAARGVVTLASTAGLSFTAGDGSDDPAMTFAGTVAAVNAALDGLAFNPSAGFSGAATLTVLTDDQGGTGQGSPLSTSSTINITVNDGGALQFSPASYSLAEGSGQMTLTVVRTGGAAGATTVTIATGDGTASAGSDYASAAGTLTFAAGETSKTFTVAVTDDGADESDETVNVTLSAVTGSGVLGSPATAVLTIVNDDAPTVSFKDGSYTFNEGHARAFVSVARGGDLSLPASVKFQTVDDPAAVPCDPAAKRADGTAFPQGAAYARCDYATTVETLLFAANEAEKQIAIPLIDDAHPDGVENLQLRLSEPQGATLGTRPEAALTITDNDSAGQPNPVGTTPFFVRQHYLDFLSREPEAGEPWTNVLARCPDVFNQDPQSPSAGCDRLLVSQSFFQSPEFQLKGLYSYLFYRVAFERRPEYAEITPDMRSLAGATPAEVFARRAQYAAAITQRPEFTQLYGGMSNEQYVGALLGRLGLTQITTEDPLDFEGAAQVTLGKPQLIDALNSNTLTRAQVLRAVVQSSEVDAAEYHGAFVAMQYYGYLRRTPEQSGYDAWLRVIKQDPNNVRQMVNGFMNSQEYRLRFGQP